ncbi:MAG: hypothetical protein M3139_01205 [Bacteroidota bacterium]|nr:hypothetical protein [Bacteroidota bacterium]
MNILKNLFRKKSTEEIQRSREWYDNEIEQYENEILISCIKNRAELIARIAVRDLTEVNQSIGDYEEELKILKITDTKLMCSIIEEKILQFKSAKLIIEQKENCN